MLMCDSSESAMGMGMIVEADCDLDKIQRGKCREQEASQ